MLLENMGNKPLVIGSTPEGRRMFDYASRSEPLAYLGSPSLQAISMAHGFIRCAPEE